MAAKGKEDSYKTELYKAYDYATTEFDKSLTLISSGMLAVSFAFIEKIVSLKEAKEKDVLIDGWYMLGIAIVLSSVAHLINILLLRLVIVYHKQEDDIIQRGIRIGGDILIQSLNLITLALILIGSLDIIAFIKLNISNGT
jgi:hypothetical protein